MSKSTLNKWEGSLNIFAQFWEECFFNINWWILCSTIPGIGTRLLLQEEEEKESGCLPDRGDRRKASFLSLSLFACLRNTPSPSILSGGRVIKLRWVQSQETFLQICWKKQQDRHLRRHSTRSRRKNNTDLFSRRRRKWEMENWKEGRKVVEE